MNAGKTSATWSNMEETLSKLVGAKDYVGVSRMSQQGRLELRLLDTLHSLTVGR